MQVERTGKEATKLSFKDVNECQHESEKNYFGHNEVQEVCWIPK